MKDMILTAWKSEVNAEKTYLKIREGVKNFWLRDRFQFLADEERKHAAYFQDFYKQQFPGEKVELPETCPVPLPEVKIDRDSIPFSDVIAMAMEAEKAASEFYASWADLMPDAEKAETEADGERTASVREMLMYISSMEMGHYRLLEIEEENAREQEQYDLVWDMTHIGP
jgi:rubrerythrin